MGSKTSIAADLRTSRSTRLNLSPFSSIISNDLAATANQTSISSGVGRRTGRQSNERFFACHRPRVPEERPHWCGYLVSAAACTTYCRRMQAVRTTDHRVGVGRRARTRWGVTALLVVSLTASIGTQFATPVDAATAAATPKVSAGAAGSVVLKSDGTVWTFGKFAIGLANQWVPQQVIGLSEITSVSSGVFHTIALKSDGTVWAFGGNEFGQLGRTPSTIDTALGQVPGLSGVVAIAAGGAHSVVLNTDGTISAFGYNAFGQLGHPIAQPLEADPVPKPVAGLSAVVAIAAGAEHTVALKSDGTVWTFGWNGAGQLGRPTDSKAENKDFAPGQVVGLSGIIAIAAGEQHTVALKSDGTVWAFGDNSTGQLGRSTQPKSIDPVATQIPGLSSITAVAVGSEHTIALASDGSVYAFGLSLEGQLGRKVSGAISDFVPTVVPGLSAVVAIAAARHHNVVLKADGSVWTFGSNTYGEAGRPIVPGDFALAPVPGFSAVSGSSSATAKPTTTPAGKTSANPTTGAKRPGKKKPKK
jgi:YD repeat-containing protein